MVVNSVLYEWYYTLNYLRNIGRASVSQKAGMHDASAAELNHNHVMINLVNKRSLLY